MSAIGLTLRGRDKAEAQMIDTCEVSRPGDVVTDPETGNVTNTPTRIYPTPEQLAAGNPGRCKVQQTVSQASNPVAGEHSFTVQDSRVDFPVDAGPFKVGDVVTMTASVLDPQLVGRTFRVDELFHKSYATAQRTRVKEVTA